MTAGGQAVRGLEHFPQYYGFLGSFRTAAPCWSRRFESRGFGLHRCGKCHAARGMRRPDQEMEPDWPATASSCRKV
jgi:hypothetical protein